MKDGFKKLNEYLEKAMALQSAMVLFEWDNETLAPKEASSYTSKVVGILSSQYKEIMTNKELKKWLRECKKDKHLTEIEQAIVREVEEEIRKVDGIPADEYRNFAELTSGAAKIWANAKNENNFEQFAPTLQKIVDYQKKFASYRAKRGQKLYDVMLDTYETGFNMKALDLFFKELKKELIPLLKKASKNSENIKDDFLYAEYPVKAQEEAAKFLVEYVGFNFDRGVLGVSAHPFTTNLHNHDVRITTHYGKKMDTSLFSVIHESGHALYEMGIRDELTQTLVGQGASMGMHESQSRFLENIVGKNEAFWEPIYPKLKEIFGEPLKNVSLCDFMKAINRVSPGLIRTEADELSYSLHILVRYEIEKMMIEEEIDVRKLPEIWNKKYEEYLGVRPDQDSEGILQDIHWSQGSFGYFPSYALGNAFGAQIYHQMKKGMDFDGLLRDKKLDVIRTYLRENIHQYGKLKTSRQILKDMTGEDFTPKYYIEYLKEKYGEN